MTESQELQIRKKAAIYVFNMEKKELKMQIPQKYVERLNDLFEKPLQIVFENE